MGRKLGNRARRNRKSGSNRKAGETLRGYFDDKGPLLQSLVAPVAASPLLGSIVDTVSDEDNNNALVEAGGQAAGGIAGGAAASGLVKALIPKRYKMLAKVLPAVAFAVGSIPGEGVGGRVATGLFGEEEESDLAKQARDQVEAWNIMKPSLREEQAMIREQERQAAIDAATIESQMAFNNALLEQATAGIDPQFVNLMNSVGAYL